MEEDKLIKKVEEINELFSDFVKILPFIELKEDESFNGKHHKLRIFDLDDEPFNILYAMFFELQYLLWGYNKRKGNTNTKMMVSKIKLTPIIPDFYGMRGFIIKIGYENNN